MRSVCLIPVALMLSACGGPQEPGEWEILSTLGSPSSPAPSGTPPLSIKLCLKPRAHPQPTRDVILAMTSLKQCQTGGAFIDYGIIGGRVHCPGSSDIPDQDQQISGSYGGRAISMAIDMPLFGQTVRQTIKARRVGECRDDDIDF